MADVQQQIEALSMTLEGQKQQLESLKDIPALLRKVTETMSTISKPNDSEKQNAESRNSKGRWSLGLSEDEADEISSRPIIENDSDTFANLFGTYIVLRFRE